MPASVHKAALVLELFSVERPDWGPTEVADELGIAKSTAHALLGELTSVGLTERLPCGRYRLGWWTVGLARTKLATSGYGEAISRPRAGWRATSARRSTSRPGNAAACCTSPANARPAGWPHRPSRLPRS